MNPTKRLPRRACLTPRTSVRHELRPGRVTRCFTAARVSDLHRIAFMRKMMPYAIYDDNDEIKRIRITYDMLDSSSRFKEFRPCIKKYLYGRIRSRILKVEPNEWDIATYLPVQQFKKAKPLQVWQDSINEIRKS